MSLRLAAPTIAAAGIACLVAAYFCGKPAHGAEPTSGFMLLVCEPHKACVQRGKTLTNATACALDAASLENVVPAGTRVGCVKVVKND